MDEPLKVAFSVASERLRVATAPFITLFERDDLSVELFAPVEADTQQPHDQDELYLVVSGSGTFRRETETTLFAAGDLLFVAAGVDHRFESFTADFTTWAIFFGPKGGVMPDG
jgi:mannose-6-phosphate isomerase-like protein (cupin superfamily)